MCFINSFHNFIDNKNMCEQRNTINLRWPNVDWLCSVFYTCRWRVFRLYKNLCCLHKIWINRLCKTIAFPKRQLSTREYVSIYLELSAVIIPDKQHSLCFTVYLSAVWLHVIREVGVPARFLSWSTLFFLITHCYYNM